MSSNVHLISRNPSPLWDNRAVGSLHAIIENRSGLERNAWRRALHQVAIVCDIPSTLMAYDPIVLEETLGFLYPEKEPEVLVGVPGSKCTRNESVDENVSGWEVLLLRCEVVRSTIRVVLRHEEVGEMQLSNR